MTEKSLYCFIHFVGWRIRKAKEGRGGRGHIFLVVAHPKVRSLAHGPEHIPIHHHPLITLSESEHLSLCVSVPIFVKWIYNTWFSGDKKEIAHWTTVYLWKAPGQCPPDPLVLIVCCIWHYRHLQEMSTYLGYDSFWCQSDYSYSVHLPQKVEMMNFKRPWSLISNPSLKRHGLRCG